MAKSRSIAEDLLEETWLRLISGGEDLQADTRLGPWLFTVAHNLYISHCRSRAREHSSAADLILLWPGGLPQSPFDLTSLSEFEERLEAAIASMPPMYREVLLLVGVEPRLLAFERCLDYLSERSPHRLITGRQAVHCAADVFYLAILN